MNKRGMGIVGFVLMWFVAIALYFMVFASMVNDQANLMLANNAGNMEGLEIFLWSNIQLVFIIGFLLSLVAGIYFLGGTV